MDNKALVLTAGIGTRLRPLTLDRAKAALPVAGEPLIRKILLWLHTQSVDETVLNLHHRPETITREIGDGSDIGLRVRYSWEQNLLGSAGGPKHALGLLSSERFFIINGDTLTDPNLKNMSELHHRSGALITMALIENPHPDRYGSVNIDHDGWITNFMPKGTTTPGYHFTGVQLVEAKAFESFSDGEVFESVSELYPRLIEQNSHAIRAFICRSKFYDVGTLPDYLSTCLSLSEKKETVVIGSRVQIASDAQLVRSVILDNVKIGSKCELVESIVGDGVQIPPGTQFSRSAIVKAKNRLPGPNEYLKGDLLIRPFENFRPADLTLSR